MTYSRRKILGNLGEFMTTHILKSKGYSILERNYQSKYGEIDIISKKESTLYFIETKLTTSNYSHPLVTWEKKQKKHLFKSLYQYLSYNLQYQDYNYCILLFHYSFSETGYVSLSLIEVDS